MAEVTVVKEVTVVTVMFGVTILTIVTAQIVMQFIYFHHVSRFFS